MVVLCFDIPRHFHFISNESIGGGFDSGSLATNEICGRGLEVGKFICNSPCLGEGMLNPSWICHLFLFE
jgi:hypothetical protein